MSSIDANKETIWLIKNLHSFDVLRADRTFNAHGLELIVPYLDKTLVKFVLDIEGHYKMPSSSRGIEKHLLRNAVKDKLPELTFARILMRDKERFSDGCGYDYVPHILNYTSKCGDKSMHLSEKEKKEKEYHMNTFKKKYNGLEHLIIKRQLPEWCQEHNKVKNANIIGY